MSCWFHHVNDRAYIDAIVDEMEHGSDSPHRQVLLTEGLIEQRKLSLGTSEAWWMDCLNCGYVFTSKLGLENYFPQWHDEMPPTPSSIAIPRSQSGTASGIQ